MSSKNKSTTPNESSAAIATSSSSSSLNAMQPVSSPFTVRKVVVLANDPKDSQAVVAMLAPSSPGGTGTGGASAVGGAPPGSPGSPSPSHGALNASAGAPRTPLVARAPSCGVDFVATMLNDKCILHLWTLWGHDKYVSVMSNVFRQCAAVVYVYNTHNLDSFMEVKSLNTTVEKYAPQAPRLLVPRSESETAPLVTQDTAQQWAKANNISFCGTSSGGAIMDSIDRMLATAPIKGKKHDFVTVNFTEFTDCKFCGGFIWGLVKQGQSCRACKYPVHHKCAKRAEEETSCL